MSAINVNSITGRTGTHGPVLTGVTTATNGLNVTGGSVGIGESLPSSYSSGANNLVISAASGSNAGITINSDLNGTDTGAIFFAHGLSANAVGRIRYYHSDDHMDFYTANAERVRITSTGDVGIGLTNPTTNLTVYGNASAAMFQNSNTGTTSGDGFFVGNYGGLSALIWQYENDIIKFGANNQERLRINSNGDLGINTTGGNYTVQMHEPSAGSFTLQLTNGAIGSASTSGTRITASSSRKLFFENQENEDTLFYNNGGEKLVIKAGGDVNITDGNLVVANGKGIDFSATGDGSGTATSELLDDYEEGTFTPTIGTINGNSFTNYTTQPVTYGNYVKVGELVYVTLYLTGVASGAGSATDSVGVGNLPFTTASNNSSGYSPVTCWPYTFWDGTNVADGAQLMSRTQVGTNFLFLQKITVSGGSAGVIASNMVSSINLMLSVCYIAI